MYNERQQSGVEDVPEVLKYYSGLANCWSDTCVCAVMCINGTA